MSKTTSMTRIGLLAVLLAMVGFSYSLATSLTDDAPDAVASPRAVGTTIPLDFANPFVAGPGSDRDLGDAVAGSALTRLVRAKGGVPPYTFTAGSLTAFSQNTLKLLSNGILTTIGTAVAKGLPSPFRFSVTVKDSFGSNPHTDTENFRLTFVSSSQFRFAKSQLADGHFFRTFSDTLNVINGKGAITFAVSNVTFTPNVGPAIPLTALEKIGLSVSKDGAIFGVPVPQGVTSNPLNGGVLTFTATATDSANAKAANRQGVGNSQTITVNIGANVIIQNTVITTKMTIKANSPGKDNLTWAGIANINGEAISALSGLNFNFRVGPYTAPTVVFDTKGKAKTPNGTKTSVVSGAVKKGGVSTFKVTKDTIALPPVTGTTVDLAVETRIGDAIIGSEILRFTVKTSNAGVVTLTYKPGPGSSPGGAGQLTKMQGSDDKAGVGDSWKATFIARIPNGSDVTGATQVVVNIGTTYTNTLQVAPKGTKVSGKADKKLPVVAQFSFDGKTGKGSYTTGVLAATGANSTGIKQAIASTLKDNFATGIFFRNTNADIVGLESGLSIFPKKTKWTSDNPVK